MSNKKSSETTYALILGYLSICGWVPRVALNLMPQSRQTISEAVAKLESTEMIASRGNRSNKLYRLLKGGGDFLTEINPIRHGLTVEENLSKRVRHESDKVRLDGLRSVISIMSALAGYAVHPHDKPELSMISAAQRREDAVSPSPVKPVYAAPPIPSEPNSIHNYADYRYRPIHPWDALTVEDTNEYRVHSSPIGCFYSRREILDEIATGTSSGRKLNPGIQGVQGSSIAGALFTGSGAYKVYHTENTAPRISLVPDANMTNSLGGWAGIFYQCSLEEIHLYKHNRHLRGSILLGDSSYRAAISVVMETLRKKHNGKMRARKNPGTNFNLVDVPQTFYLPYIREALPVYSAMIYPQFELALRNIADSYRLIATDQIWTPVHNLSGCFDAIAEDGRDIACVFPLKLDRILEMIERAKNNGIIIYCPEYEVVFYNRLFELLDEGISARFEVRTVPQDFIEKFYIGELQMLLSYDGPYPCDEENRWTLLARKRQFKLGG